jgi:hypothetical protein
MNRFTAIGIALGLTAGAVAFVSGAQHPSNTLPPTPAVESDWRTKVSYSEPAPVASPIESAPVDSSMQLPAPININDVKPGTRCNPYVNGTYVGELCGDHDAFAEKAERTARPL